MCWVPGPGGAPRCSCFGSSGACLPVFLPAVDKIDTVTQCPNAVEALPVEADEVGEAVEVFAEDALLRLSGLPPVS